MPACPRAGGRSCQRKSRMPARLSAFGPCGSDRFWIDRLSPQVHEQLSTVLGLPESFFPRCRNSSYSRLPCCNRQRHRDCLAGLGLIRMNPRDAPHQIDLRPLQARHVRAAQPGFEAESVPCSVRWRRQLDQQTHRSASCWGQPAHIVGATPLLLSSLALGRSHSHFDRCVHVQQMVEYADDAINRSCI